MKNLKCEMKDQCPNAVTHIDVKGFIYCHDCAQVRKTYCRARKLTSKEVKQLQSGQPLTKY